MTDISEYRDRLWDVFNVCDQEQSGYISVEHFQDLAAEHFGAESVEEVTGIVQHLDPEGKGQISFDNFCQGVQQILQIKGSPRTPTKPVLFPAHPLTFTRPTISSEEQDTSNGTFNDTSEHTYNEYDLSDTDNQASVMPSNGYDYSRRDISVNRAASSEDDHDSAFSGPSNDDHRRENENTDEDNFEDFGEVDSCDELSGSDSLSVPKRKYRPTRKQTSSPRNHQPDEVFDEIDGNFIELNDRVKQLQSQIGLISDSQMQNDDRHVRLREENISLRERIHILEEQLRDCEYKSQDRIHEERRKHKDALARIERDKSSDVDTLTHQLHSLRREYDDLREDHPRLKSQIEKLRNENGKLEDKLTDSLDTLSRVSLDFANLQERHKVHENDNEMKIEEMSKELEELRQYRKEAETQRSRRSSSFAELPARYVELESEVNKLRLDTKHLKEANDDLSAQLLNQNIEEGRNLIRSGSAIGDSLAAEIEQLSKDELMEALREQKEDNAKLREYMDKVLQKIIENYPAILEK